MFWLRPINLSNGVFTAPGFRTTRRCYHLGSTPAGFCRLMFASSDTLFLLVVGVRNANIISYLCHLDPIEAMLHKSPNFCMWAVFNSKVYCSTDAIVHFNTAEMESVGKKWFPWNTSVRLFHAICKSAVLLCPSSQPCERASCWSFRQWGSS